MALEWTNKVDGVDICSADDVNNLAAAIKANEQGVSNLGNDKLDKTSVVNDLTTGGTTVPLSAEQGKALNTSISQLADDHKLKVASIEKELNDYQKVMAGVNVNNEPKQTVTGYGVISLPENAANGQVSSVVKGNTITNKAGDTSPQTITLDSTKTYLLIKTDGGTVNIDGVDTAVPTKITGKTSTTLMWTTGKMGLYELLSTETGLATDLANKYTYVGGANSTVSASRLKSVGKNLLTSTFKATNIGLNVENISDSSFKVNNSAYQGKKFKAKVNPGETYTFSAKQKDYTNIGVYFGYIDVATNKSFYTANKGETESFKHTVTIPNGVNEVYLDLRTSQAPTNKTFYDLQFERGSIATTCEPYTESIQYLPNVGELRSLPNGTKDEIRNGQHIQRIGVKTSVASGTVVNYTDMVTGGQFVAHLADGTQQVGIKGDTLIALATQLTYQLATPIVTPIEVSGTLLSYPSGTVYIENAVADAGIYTDKMTVLNADFPIATLERIVKIDFATGLETPLDVLTGTIAADGLSLTHPDLTEGDIVFFTYFYDKESTVGELTVEYYDSRYVLKDSVTGKYYKVVQSVADGELTQTLVEV